MAGPNKGSWCFIQPDDGWEIAHVFPSAIEATKWAREGRIPYHPWQSLTPEEQKAIANQPLWGTPTQMRIAAKPQEGQMDLGIRNYVYRYFVMHGDWYTGSYLHEADAEAAAEADRAKGIDAKVVCQAYDETGAPREACPRCQHMMLKGGVCPSCNYNPRFAMHPKQRGTNPDNPWGVTEDFSHTVPDAEWNIVEWPNRGWHIEVNAPGKTPAGGWGPFPSYEAAEKYVTENTVLGQKPLFNHRDTLPGSMSDIYGE